MPPTPPPSPPHQPDSASPRRPAGSASSPASTAPASRRLPAILLSALLAWSALAFFRAAWTTAVFSLGPQRNYRLASRWLPGTRQVEQLERFLRVVAATTPPGSRVAFLSDKSFTSDGLYADLWAAYLLPEREVVPAADPRAWAAASYAAAWRTRLEAPGLVLIRTTADGAIYRKLR
jgi:hypothetical protein